LSRPPTTPSDIRIAVSPAEAARLAGIGRTLLYRAISSRELASFTLGRRRLIRVAELERWLAAHELS